MTLPPSKRSDEGAAKFDERLSQRVKENPVDFGLQKTRNTSIFVVRESERCSRVPCSCRMQKTAETDILGS